MTSKIITGMIVKKGENFNDWYNELVVKAKLIEYYDVNGCYVFLPNSYGIWEEIQKYLDKSFKDRGVKNAYFPLFISEKNLSREESHIAGFTPEVAWVTQAGSSKLNEKIAVRPTSECAIYSVLPKLIQSHNDLPLKLNQFCNVVRWEFSDAVPFIRSREFLWQEGHTAFSNIKDAIAEVYDIISLYKQTYKNMLAVPVIMGKKTLEEKFAGAVETLTVETFIPSVGKAVQAATAHCLGDNFSKMFDIRFNDKDQKQSYIIQNSWGFTTRSIGIMLMLHGDDKGAVIPPYIASRQIIIVPVVTKKTEADVMIYVEKVRSTLALKYRVEVDTRDNHPGWKYNHWELMGVPIRLEIGIRDVEKKSAVMYRRDIGNKVSITVDDKIYDTIDATMIDMNTNMYNIAREKLKQSIVEPKDVSNLSAAFGEKKMCLINWCGSVECIEMVKNNYKAKSLCIPEDSEFNLVSKIKTCVICGKEGKTDCLFGKSY